MSKKGKKKIVKKKEEDEICCEPEPKIKVKMMCCKAEAIVSIDGRGQIVLPKDLRKKAKLKAGDKFAVVTSESNGDVCCIMLLKADDFADTLKGAMGPMMKGILE